MLLGHGLQRINTYSSTASVKENAEKKKKEPFATCSSGSSSTDGISIKAYLLYHSININPILCDASRSRTAENQHLQLYRIR